MRYVFLLVTIFFIGCSSTSKSTKEVGIHRNNDNKKFYKYGFSDYSIESVNSKYKGSETTYNEVRFYDVYNALSLQKIFQKKYGDYDFEVKDDHLPMKVWKDIEIFPGAFYTIATDGMENKNEIYTSVSVFNSNGKDCLNDMHPDKKLLIKFFSEALKSQE